MAPMPRAQGNGIEIEYETVGLPDDPPLLLVNGLGSQLVSWEQDFVDGFVDRGFFVIRFDNREVGLTTKLDTSGLAEGEAPFLISDMAGDAVAVLDALGLDDAHVVGQSMGGMIAQALAIEHPERVASLTSIMSTTGDADVGQPTPEAMAALLDPSPPEREAYIEKSVAGSRVIGSPEHFEEDRARAKAARTYDRCFYPKGVANQLVAVVSSPSRSEGLRGLSVDALVIHGDVDPLVTLSGGERTAECIPGAELLVLEGMGHDLPSVFWPAIIENVTRLAARSAAGA
jgi:pimeloyl-ACP methyl ester carboxylesterase